MDTHAIYEGAMRLLAARQASVEYGRYQVPDIKDASDSDITNAVDLAARTWKAAHDATVEQTRTVSRMPGTPSADAFRSAGAV